MRIDHKTSHFLFSPDSVKDVTFLNEFSGLLRDGMNYYCSTHPLIIFNIYQRIKAKYKGSISVDEETKNAIESEFKLKELPEDFKFHTEPMRHQLIALRYIYTFGSGGILLDPGMGKTKVVLDYIKLMGFKKSIIVCPKSLLFVWEDEIQTHRPELSIHVVQTTNWEKENVDADIIAINYEKAVLGEDWLGSLNPDYLHLDEALIKDYKTNRTKSLTKLAKNIPYKSLGSGTLVNGSPMDVFAPIRFMYPELVGNGITKFRKRYCVTPKDKPSVVVGFKDIPEVRSILDSCCIVMTKEAWLDLPEKVRFDIEVDISSAQSHAYNELAGNYITEIDGKYIEVDSPLTAMAKLIQISNGFVYIPKEDEDDATAELFGKTKKVKKKETYFFPEQPKIEALKGLLVNKLSRRRMIIWFNLSAEGELISRLLKDLGIEFETIQGGEKHTGEKVRRFNKSSTIQVLLCQAKSVNYGITVLGNRDDEDLEIVPTLTSSVYTHVFYSQNMSLEVDTQQEDRSHRMGMVNAPEYYRIIAKTPVERRIRELIKDKKEIRGQILIDVIRRIGDLLV